MAQAATLESAFAIVFEKLNANIAAKGEVVALLPHKNEVIIEFVDDLVPAHGAELMVFGDNGVDERSGKVYRGSVTVNESAGHMNRAIIGGGDESFAEGDQVFLPEPVQLYITPVTNLTQNPFFTAQATSCIAHLLSSFPNFQVFSLPASNRKTVDFLMQKCRNEGRYGMIIQPFVVFQNGRTKAQLRLTSLFSGQSLGALEDEFTPFVSPPQTLRSYR